VLTFLENEEAAPYPLLRYCTADAKPTEMRLVLCIMIVRLTKPN